MELIIDGRYLSLHTAWGDLDWSLCWPGYSDEATFDVARQPSWFKPGLLGFLVWGGQKMFAGTLEEPTRGSQMRLTGLHRLGENYAALDGLGAMSLAPNEALTTTRPSCAACRGRVRRHGAHRRSRSAQTPRPL